MLFSKKLKSYCNTESGRSMIEMLGVLAIVGVLSIASIAGYRFAVVKFQTAETIEEIRARSIDISAQLENNTEFSWGQELATAFPEKTSLGYTTKTSVMERNQDYFQILLSDIPYDLCVQILNDYESQNIIFVNDTRFVNNTSLCEKEGTNQLGFVFANDLSSYTECGVKAEFSAETLSCHCSGNAYINMDTNECECPKGHVWSETDHDCIETICDPGYFETLSNGCVPCTDSATYEIPADDRQRALCRACQDQNGNQIRDTIIDKNGVNTHCVNTVQNNCVLGESFRRANGTCLPCDTKNGFPIGSDETSINLCTACGRQIAWGYYNSHYCVLPTMCEKGSEYIFDNAAGTGLLQCISCDTLSEARYTYTAIGSLFQEYCNACREDNQQSRTYYNTAYYPTCQKTKCDSGEFKGADGKCYLCSDPTKRAVNAGSGCSDSSCNRNEVMGTDGKTYCQKTCQTNDGTHVEINGNCYPCEGTVDFSATKAQCDLCTSPKRLWVGNYGSENTGGTCMEMCELGKEAIMHAGQKSCMSCDGYHEGYIPSQVKDDVMEEYCIQCGNYLVTEYITSTGNSYPCISPKSCSQGSEFRKRSHRNYKFCTSCDLTDPVEIGDSDGHRNMCLNCTTTKRFWAGDYCYPCTSKEKPIVTTEAEENSCLSCPERIIEDGFCILPQ